MTVNWEQVTAALAATPPFGLLGETDRRDLAGRMRIEYHQSGETVLEAGGPVDFVRLVLKGGVRVFDPRIPDVWTDLRGTGEAVELKAAVDGAVWPRAAETVEETLCYLIPVDALRGLVERYPALALAVRRPLAFCDFGPETPAASDRLDGQNEDALFSVRAGDLIARPPVCCGPDLPVRQAAALMDRAQVGSMVLVDAAGRLMGMMTDRDLRSLWARGGDGDQPVRTLAGAKPVSVQMDATGFEALSVMAKNNIHHLPVLDKWNLKGVITARDLLLRQGANPVSVVKDVASAASPDQLVGLRAKVDRLVKVLIRRNLSAADVLDVVNHINDRLIRRVMDLSLAALEDEGHGAPPAPWALVGLGAAGRKEQVLGTGLSLGLVFADGDGDDNRRRDAWFSVLADRLDDGLKRAGFQIPPQGPSNDRNRRSRPVSDWQNDFKAWIRRPDPETLKWAAPFFDGRLIAGREDLVHDVIRAGRRELTDNPDFMTALARSAVRGPDRLGWFHGRLVDDRGRPAPGAGLEEAGLRPLVDAVRTLSLARRLPPTNTLDRLTALRESGALDPTMAQDAADAYACLFKARLVRFLENPDRPWFDPPHLPFYSDPARNQAIKEALAAVRRIRDRIRGRWLAAAA